MALSIMIGSVIADKNSLLTGKGLLLGSKYRQYAHVGQESNASHDSGGFLAEKPSIIPTNHGHEPDKHRLLGLEPSTLFDCPYQFLDSPCPAHWNDHAASLL